eukprot:gene28725-30979_t
MIAVTLASFALLANVVSQRPGAGSTMCLMLDGSYKPCGPSTSSQCGQPRPRSSPQYHIRDESCAMNDPNGPFYDELHGMYHLMNGPVWGHVVSRDLVHWARLPVTIWNDQ